MISVVIPTIKGRRSWLEQCTKAYRRTLRGAKYEILIEHDHPTCGLAWQAGIGRARGDYIHLSADDLTPKAGWWQGAVAMTEAGAMPAPYVLNPDGSLQTCGEGTTWLTPNTATSFSRVPFGTREMFHAIGPMFTGHYYTDNWVSHRGRLCGYPTLVCEGYTLVHHWAQEGRLDDRFQADGALYQQWVAA